MQLVDDRLILSASDLINQLECAHLTSLDLGVARGALTLEETRTDAAARLSGSSWNFGGDPGGLTVRR